MLVFHLGRGVKLNAFMYMEFSTGALLPFGAGSFSVVGAVLCVGRHLAASWPPVYYIPMAKLHPWLRITDLRYANLGKIMNLESRGSWISWKPCVCMEMAEVWETA